MISSKNLFLGTFAKYVCWTVLIFVSSNLFAKQVDQEAYKIVSNKTFITFLDNNHTESFHRDFTDFIYLSLHEVFLVISGIFISLLFFWFVNKQKNKVSDKPGFKLINFKDQEHYIPLKSESQSLEFLEKLEITNEFRLSGNLNRVILTPLNNTFLLEDKNFKNALLINRRRLHRKVLYNNDILDIGEMVLIYRNNLFFEKNSQCEESLGSQQVFQPTKPRGPIQSGIPVLQVAGGKQEIILVRNLNTLGTSKNNDIIIKSDEAASRHAKIYKVGQFWKIQNLQNYENTFVNGRRIDQRFLKEGDEIAIGEVFFKFITNKSQIKKPRKLRKESKVR